MEQQTWKEKLTRWYTSLLARVKRVWGKVKNASLSFLNGMKTTFSRGKEWIREKGATGASRGKALLSLWGKKGKSLLHSWKEWGDQVGQKLPFRQDHRLVFSAILGLVLLLTVAGVWCAHAFSPPRDVVFFVQNDTLMAVTEQGKTLTLCTLSHTNPQPRRDPSRDLLYAVDGEGTLFSLSPQGERKDLFSGVSQFDLTPKGEVVYVTTEGNLYLDEVLLAEGISTFLTGRTGGGLAYLSFTGEAFLKPEGEATRAVASGVSRLVSLEEGNVLWYLRIYKEECSALSFFADPNRGEDEEVTLPQKPQEPEGTATLPDPVFRDSFASQADYEAALADYQAKCDAIREEETRKKESYNAAVREYNEKVARYNEKVARDQVRSALAMKRVEGQRITLCAYRGEETHPFGTVLTLPHAYRAEVWGETALFAYVAPESMGEVSHEGGIPSLETEYPLSVNVVWQGEKKTLLHTAAALYLAPEGDRLYTLEEGRLTLYRFETGEETVLSDKVAADSFLMTFSGEALYRVREEEGDALYLDETLLARKVASAGLSADGAIVCFQPREEGEGYALFLVKGERKTLLTHSDTPLILS